MDKTTYDVRLTNWKSIIERCQSRPQDQSAKQWLEENNVSEKQYYYWLRKIRSEAYQEIHASLPDKTEKQELAPVAFVEFSGKEIMEHDTTPAVIIQTSKSTIKISSGVSEKLMLKLVKAVAHAF